MTSTSPPTDPDRSSAPPPADELPTDLEDGDQDLVGGETTEGVSEPVEGDGEEVVAKRDEPITEADDSPSDLVDEIGVDEVGEGEATTVQSDPFPPEEVSLFVVPTPEPISPTSNTKDSREMGWKMMAVAGVLLLVGGFVAGVFFPESSPAPSETSATTVTTGPASEPSTPSTSSPPATSPPTTEASAAPTTTMVKTPTAEVEVPDVEAPALVETDEPVSDVADRMVPSVVHLEVQGESPLEQGAGSGVVIDSSGYILTAAHVVSAVVENGAELTVRLSNGDRLPGEVVGTDPDADVAVIKVERSGLTPAEMALEGRPRVGQMVVAVGSPWGLESSVTSGVISAVDRIVEGRVLLQSDAVLYPGNSGGALADRYGRLIGINVSIFTDSSALDSIEFQGVGFAVPISIAHRVAQALIAGEPVHTTFLGISGRDTQGDAGVEIIEVFPGSGAEQSGLKPGDVVVGVGGRPVTGIADLAARIRHLSPGDVIILNVLRGEDQMSLAATLLPRSEVMLGEEEPPEDPPEE